jgi:hypothetical protein
MSARRGDVPYRTGREIVPGTACVPRADGAPLPTRARRTHCPRHAVAILSLPSVLGESAPIRPSRRSRPRLSREALHQLHPEGCAMNATHPVACAEDADAADPSVIPDPGDAGCRGDGRASSATAERALRAFVRSDATSAWREAARPFDVLAPQTEARDTGGQPDATGGGRVLSVSRAGRLPPRERQSVAFRGESLSGKKEVFRPRRKTDASRGYRCAAAAACGAGVMDRSIAAAMVRAAMTSFSNCSG